MGLERRLKRHFPAAGYWVTKIGLAISDRLEQSMA